VALGAGMGIEKMRFGPPLVMLALGGMTLALTAAALWRVLDPLTRTETGAAKASAAARPGRLRELEREKQLVLKAIKEIELDYQMKKIAERDYREMVERYRGRALRLISEIEAGDDFRGLIERELKIRLDLPSAEPPKPQESAAATSATTPGCPSCQTVNDADAQFCKKCGSKLG
jgi:zinc ribbon protein